MLRMFLLRASRSSWLESQARRRAFARRAVRRFLPGETLEEAMAAADVLAERRIPGVLTELGEGVASEEGADAALAGYERAIGAAADRELDVQISVKPSHLGLRVGYAGTLRRLKELLAHVRGVGSVLWLDMEESDTVEPTLRLYGELLASSDPESKPPVGICLQAYLHRTPEDLDRIVSEGGRIRLVKGAYREDAGVALQTRPEVDAAFSRLAERLGVFAEQGHVLGTHDLGILEELGINTGDRGKSGLEVQMLYGIQEGEWDRLVQAGVPFRVLISYGEHWYPWFMRRLAERPSNLRFLLGGGG